MVLDDKLDNERNLAQIVTETIYKGEKILVIEEVYDNYVSYVANLMSTNQFYDIQLFKLVKKIYDGHIVEVKNEYNK